jgi:hypothetical protein
VYELALVVVAACCVPLLFQAALMVVDRLVREALFPGERAPWLLNKAFFPEGRAPRLLSEAVYRERQEAEARARRLLERNLSAEQRRTLAKSGFIDVRACGGRVYRLARSGSVARLSEDGKYLTEQYCIVPTVAMPPEDRLLALKLMLETDEEEFLKTACRRGTLTLLPRSVRGPLPGATSPETPQ